MVNRRFEKGIKGLGIGGSFGEEEEDDDDEDEEEGEDEEEDGEGDAVGEDDVGADVSGGEGEEGKEDSNSGNGKATDEQRGTVASKANHDNPDSLNTAASFVAGVNGEVDTENTPDVESNVEVHVQEHEGEAGGGGEVSINNIDINNPEALNNDLLSALIRRPLIRTSTRDPPDLGRNS